MIKRKSEESNTISIQQFIDSILRNAVNLLASDIHLEEDENSALAIRYRVDGILREQPINQIFESEKVIGSLKVTAGLDITGQDVPQEGHFVFDDPASMESRPIDVRVSIFPTIYGESIVMRLLNRSTALIPLSEIGFDSEELKKVNRLIHKAHGMVLMTGPVNSGKSTTLYSIIEDLKSPQKNIVTLEDPVEYQMTGIRQSQIVPARGYDFTHGLRSVLRQDPDIIMVGEIRDADTAEIAIRASLTGRLVLSTLHTNTAIATIARLVDMGVQHWLVANALNGVIAQRLVGKICLSCKTRYTPSPEVLQVLNLTLKPDDIFYKGAGCAACGNTGFLGRMGIFEVLEMTEDLRTMILERASASAMKDRATELGMAFLPDEGIARARQGLTTLEEVARIATA